MDKTKKLAQFIEWRNSARKEECKTDGHVLSEYDLRNIIVMCWNSEAYNINYENVSEAKQALDYAEEYIKDSEQKMTGETDFVMDEMMAVKDIIRHSLLTFFKKQVNELSD